METTKTTKKITNALQTLQSDLGNLLLSNKGVNKEKIYRPQLFEGVKNVKALRTTYRNAFENICKSILAANKEDKKKIATSFAKYYKEVYLLNNYSLNSISSANLAADKKKLFLAGLTELKENLTK